jgi:hypothetical protein
VLSAAYVAILDELGIVRWRARPGQAFPGAGLRGVSEDAPNELLCRVDKHRASTEPQAATPFDLCLYANTHSEAEAELLARIIHAAQGLRGDLRMEHHLLDAPQQFAHAQVRLDDVDLPSPATMLLDASSKRRVWQALQAAVARLP